LARGSSGLLGDKVGLLYIVVSLAAPLTNAFMINRYLTSADKLRLAFIGLALLIFSIAHPISPLTIKWASFLLPYFLIGGLAAVGIAYRSLDRDEGIAAACLVLAQILLFSDVAVFDNYLGLALHRPLIDEFLAEVDRRAGIDWWAYVIPLAACCGYFLPRFDPPVRLPRQVACLYVIRIDDDCPLGSVPELWRAGVPSHGLPTPPFDLFVSRGEATQLLTLYEGPVPPLRFSNPTGLIGFPSFHTVMAVLTVQAAWEIPFVGLLALACNILVLLAVPADGGHHFVDVGGGIFVAIVSISSADAVLRQANFAKPSYLRTRRA
jgi:hypothetical protein